MLLTEKRKITHALAHRRRSFLADYKWLTIPWEGIEKSDKDLLLDYLVQLPSLLEQVDMARAECIPHLLQLRLDTLLKGCQNLERHFKEWYENMKDHLGGLSYYIEQPTLTGSTMEASDFISYNFPDADIAHVMTLYWTGLHILYSIFEACYCIAEDLSPAVSDNMHEYFDSSRHVNPFRKDSNTKAAMEMMSSAAIHLARSIPYFLQPDMNDFGPRIITFPLAMAIFFPNKLAGGQSAWWTAILQRLEDRGMSIAGFLRDLIHKYGATA